MITRKGIHGRNNPFQLPSDYFAFFSGERAPLPAQIRAGRNDAQSRSAFNEAAMHRSPAEQRVGRPAAQFGVDQGQFGQRSSQRQNGVNAFFRPAAVGGLAADLDFKPGEPLVGNTDLFLGRFQENPGRRL